MPDVEPEMLYQWWRHSHEEDSGEDMVFRPASFDFPPSRGRMSFELRPGGSLAERGIGPADAPVESSGTWELRGDTLLLHGAGGAEDVRVFRIVSLDEERLVVRM